MLSTFKASVGNSKESPVSPENKDKKAEKQALDKLDLRCIK